MGNFLFLPHAFLDGKPSCRVCREVQRLKVRQEDCITGSIRMCVVLVVAKYHRCAGLLVSNLWVTEEEAALRAAAMALSRAHQSGLHGSSEDLAPGF